MKFSISAKKIRLGMALFATVLIALFSGRLDAAVINVNVTQAVPTSSTTTNPGYGLWNQGTQTWNLSNANSVSNLVDSTGAATSVGYAIVNGGSRNTNSSWGPDTLTNQGAYGANDDITVMITTVSGLVANQAYSLIVYHANNNRVETQDVNGQAPVDFTGSTTTSGGSTYGDAFDAGTLRHFWYYGSVNANSSGQLIISSSGAGFETISGFQLESVPEPSAALLLSAGLFGLVARRRR